MPNPAVEADASQARFARLLAPLTSFRYGARVSLSIVKILASRTRRADASKRGGERGCQRLVSCAARVLASYTRYLFLGRSQCFVVRSSRRPPPYVPVRRASPVEPILVRISGGLHRGFVWRSRPNRALKWDAPNVVL
jgi:hypothetical protein